LLFGPILQVDGLFCNAVSEFRKNAVGSATMLVAGFPSAAGFSQLAGGFRKLSIPARRAFPAGRSFPNAEGVVARPGWS
jgi:hypothetical protein